MKVAKISYVLAFISLLVAIVLSVMKGPGIEGAGIATFVFLAIGIIITVVDEIIKMDK